MRYTHWISLCCCLTLGVGCDDDDALSSAVDAAPQADALDVDGEQDASTPDEQDASAPDEQDASAPDEQDASSSDEQDASAPEQDASTPGQDASTPVQDASTPAQDASTPAQDASAEDQGVHDIDLGEVDPSDETLIELSDDGVTITGPGARAEGSLVTIFEGGAYRAVGALSDGAIIVDSSEAVAVLLTLDGVTITSSTTAPLQILDAEATILHLEAGTTSTLTDAEDYVFATPEEDEPNAALFTDDDLLIEGEGALVIHARYNDGIGGKDGIIIEGGDITIDAADDGVRGKEYLEILGGALDVTAGGDGLKSDQADDASLGYVLIDAGEVRVEVAADGVDAETRVVIRGGEVEVISGGGAGGFLGASDSAKGLKGTLEVQISGGNTTISSADDAIHSNGDVSISGGTPRSPAATTGSTLTRASRSTAVRSS